jgi:hypothetical protein
LLYWFKSTNTDAQFCANQPETLLAGTQFTGFTGTKEQILALCAVEQLRASSSVAATRIYYSVYLLYWHKRTNTDAARLGTYAVDINLLLILLLILPLVYYY